MLMKRVLHFCAPLTAVSLFFHKNKCLYLQVVRHLNYKFDVHLLVTANLEVIKNDKRRFLYR